MSSLISEEKILFYISTVVSIKRHKKGLFAKDGDLLLLRTFVRNLLAKS